MPKIEDWVDLSHGEARADVIHGRLVVLGFTGTERTTRRAVAQVKAASQPAAASSRSTLRRWERFGYLLLSG